MTPEDTVKSALRDRLDAARNAIKLSKTFRSVSLKAAWLRYAQEHLVSANYYLGLLTVRRIP